MPAWAPTSCPVGNSRGLPVLCARSTRGAAAHGRKRASSIESNSFLEDDLLRGMIELLPGEPAPMRQRPMASSAVNPTVPQQKGKQLAAFAAKVVRHRLAGPNKVAHRLMRRVWRPDSRLVRLPGAVAPV